MLRRDRVEQHAVAEAGDDAECEVREEQCCEASEEAAVGGSHDDRVEEEGILLGSGPVERDNSSVTRHRPRSR